MGITLGTLRYIIRKFKDNKPTGKALTLGVHGVDCSYDNLIYEFEKEGYNYTKLDKNIIKNDTLTQFGDSVHQNTFFMMLGFKKVESLDAFDEENPTYVIDLNKKIKNKKLINNFDALFDFGTTEHCFNIPQVLVNISQFLKVGGHLIQGVPINNWINHGYYQISPVLLYDFYSANGFKNLNHVIYFAIPSQTNMYAKEYIITNTAFFARLDIPKYKAGIVFDAIKEKNTPKPIYPIQGYYRQTFGKEVLNEYQINNSEPIINQIV